MAWDPNMIASQSVSTQKEANILEAKRLEFDEKRYEFAIKDSVFAKWISVISLLIAIASFIRGFFY